MIALALASGLVVMIGRLGLGAGLFDVARLIAATVFVTLLGIALWSERRALGRVAFRDERSHAARSCVWIALAYLAGALALFVARVLGSEPVHALAILAPAYCGAVAAGVFAALMAVLLGRRDIPQNVQASSDRRSTVGDVPGDGPPRGGSRDGTDTAIAGAVAAAVWAGGVALAWGVPLRAESTGKIHAFWAILLVLFLTRIAWIAIRAAFDRRLGEERQATVPGEADDDAAIAGRSSRLGTVLPLLRSFLLITVAVLAAMIVLSQLGVDVAPLFAGAGLVGIAVGFGAQSLVRDIFSGLFFLVDDAFRAGEYIETGGLRGTVERISIRSMQLRHQNGPLHTIPFGEIAQLTNYSRDWVIMKLPIRVTFDTDPERVRKLIKKLGQELMADPQIGSRFVQPLKSQGVREISDSGQIIRVKFMTRPGEQFVLRKIVYARIRELFAREGIEFAAREVRVRVSTEGGPLPEPEAQRVAAAAAERALNP